MRRPALSRPIRLTATDVARLIAAGVDLTECCDDPEHHGIAPTTTKRPLD